MSSKELLDAGRVREAEESVERFVSRVARLRTAIGRVIVSQEDVVDGAIMGLLAGGHLLLEGVPGLGKTLIAKTLSQCLSLTFSRIQFTPDLMPADITGTMVIYEGEGRRDFRFQPGPLFAQMILADEINRGTPKTQSALLEAMEEFSVTVGDTTHQLPQPFFVIGTRNQIEMEGTYPLPEAQLDRFLIKLNITLPDRESVHEILDRTTQNEMAQSSPVMGADALIQMRRLVRNVAIAKEIQDHAVRIMFASHPEEPEAPSLVRKYVELGSSPRGAQAMVLCAKVRALLDSRFVVSRSDIRAVAHPALRHRLLLNLHASVDGVQPDGLIDSILEVTGK